MSAEPRVSVIIPTHNRVDSLMRTVRAFEAQDIDPGSLELIVVADGCTDDTERAFRSHRTRFRSRILPQEGLGAAAARNLGAQVAGGAILLFMDDDVEPLPGLVEAHLRAHQAQPGRVVLGPYPPSRQGPASFYHMRTRSWWESLFAQMAQTGHRFHYRDLVSGNVSIGARRYGDLGGFNPAIRGAGGEDYEFGARVIKAGIDIAFEPEARAVHHQHETMTLAGSLERAAQEGRANVIIGRLHPEVRADLFGEFTSSRVRYFRRVRFLAFRGRAVGRFLARLVLLGLPLLEALKMRQRWRKAVGAIHGYWYWRGVADEIGSRAALSEYMKRGPLRESGEVTVLDLADGLEVAEAGLDVERPSSVRLRFGEQEVGLIEHEALAEPLRGSHLRPILATRFTFQIVRALASHEPPFAELGLLPPVGGAQ